MAFTRAERERIADNRMKIRSVANSLAHLDPKKIDDIEAIQECLDGADKSLKGALDSEDSPDHQHK